VVYGEAMLSMQSREQKIELWRKPGDFLLPEDGTESTNCVTRLKIFPTIFRHEIQAALSKEIHVGVQPLSHSGWIRLFEQNGLKVTWSTESPMHLLEPQRILRDEGLRGSLRVAFNIARDPKLRQRIFAMRRLFTKYRKHLCASLWLGNKNQRMPDSVHQLSNSIHSG